MTKYRTQIDKFIDTPLKPERDTMPAGRVCQHCPVALSIYNPKPYCAAHAKAARYEELRIEAEKHIRHHRKWKARQLTSSGGAGK